MIESQYLEFRREEIEGRKTPIVHVHSKSSGTELARIAWYGPWRQFTFWPEPHTVWNTGCLNDVLAAIAELMEERKS